MRGKDQPEKYARGRGFVGEAIAEQYLIKRGGYEIIEKNFYTYFGEIDLIVKDLTSRELVFVEVKTRSSDAYGLPEEAVTKIKKARIAKSIDVYLRKNRRYEDSPKRVDVLAIQIDSGAQKAKVYHYKNIDFGN